MKKNEQKKKLTEMCAGGGAMGGWDARSDEQFVRVKNIVFSGYFRVVLKYKMFSRFCLLFILSAECMPIHAVIRC